MCLPQIRKLSSCVFTKVVRMPCEKVSKLLLPPCDIVEGHSHKNIRAEKKYVQNILLKAP